MSKIKTLSSAAKRFRRTASGNFKRRHANLQHILTKKAVKRKRRLRSTSLISKKDIALVLRCLPYM